MRLGKRGVVYAAGAGSYKEENWGSQVQFVVDSQLCTGLEHGSRGTAIVNVRYQETFSEDTTGWKRLSVYSSNLYNVEISDSVKSYLQLHL
jgi:hypothetical protein